MPKDVLITPASGILEFKDSASIVDATIQLDDSGNLNITNSGGDLFLGNSTANLYVGNGTSSTDIIFEQNGAIRALNGKTLTLGQSDSSIIVNSSSLTVNNAIKLTSIEPNPKINFIGATSNVGMRVGSNGSLIFEGSTGQLFTISDNTSENIFSISDISGLPIFNIDNSSNIKLNQYGGYTVFGASAAIQDASSANAKVSISTASASTPGLIIKGAASQTSNVLEVYKDNSALALSVRNNLYGVYIDNLTVGNNVYSNYQIVGGVISGNLGNVLHQFNSWNASWATVGVRGFASQTANLQEWQNSAGTVLAKVTSDGSIITPGLSVQYGIYSTTAGKASINPNYDTGSMGIYTENAANKGLVVRGAASQTANLQEWQNSSGTVLAKIDKDGNLTANNVRGSGAFNYVQTLGTKQTSISGASAALVSATITTVGYPVHIVVTGDAENNSAGGWARLQLYRDSTAIGNKVHVEGSASSENIPFALQFIDTPSAGTYTYSIKTVDTAGGTFNFGETDGPTITIIELGK